MLTIKNVKTQSGTTTDVFIQNASTQTLDAKAQLFCIPSFIDVDNNLNINTSHEDWTTIGKTFLLSGITTIFVQAISPQMVKTQRTQIEDFLKKSKIPLNVCFIADGTDVVNFDDIGRKKAFFKGIKTKIDLQNIPLPPFKNALERIFQIAAQEDLIVIIDLLQDKENEAEERKAALKTINLAIGLTEKYNAQLCLQHVRTQEEIALIREAKKQNLLIFAEIGFPHLFISEANASEAPFLSSYFLPTPKDQNALWAALNNGHIDMIGSGSPIFQERYSVFTSQLWLPSILTAYQEKKMSLDTLIAMTRVNAQNIFSLAPNEDVALIDFNLNVSIVKEHEKNQTIGSIIISEMNSLSSSKIKTQKKLFDNLTGYPAYIIAQGEVLKGSFL